MMAGISGERQYTHTPVMTPESELLLMREGHRGFRDYDDKQEPMPDRVSISGTLDTISNYGADRKSGQVTL